MPKGKPTAKEIETVYPESVRKEDYAWERAIADSRQRLTQELEEAKQNMSLPFRIGRDVYDLENRLAKLAVPPDVQHRLNIYKAQEEKYGHVLTEPPAKKQKTLTAAEAKKLLFPDDSDTDIDEGSKADPFASPAAPNPAAPVAPTSAATEPTNDVIVISDDSDVEVGSKEDPFLSAPAEQKATEEKKAAETYNFHHVPETDEEIEKLLDHIHELEAKQRTMSYEERKESNLTDEIDKLYELWEKGQNKHSERLEHEMYLAQIKEAEEREAKEKAAIEEGLKEIAAKREALEKKVAEDKAAEEKAAESYTFDSVPITEAEASKLARHKDEIELKWLRLPFEQRPKSELKRELDRLEDLYEQWLPIRMEKALRVLDLFHILDAEEEELRKKARAMKGEKPSEEPIGLSMSWFSEKRRKHRKKPRGGADFDDDDGDDFEPTKPRPKKRKVERIVEEKVISDDELARKQKIVRAHIGDIFDDIQRGISSVRQERGMASSSVTRGFAIDIVNILMCLYTIHSAPDLQQAFSKFRMYLDDFVVDMAQSRLHDRAVWAHRHRHLEEDLLQDTVDEPVMRRKTPQGPKELVDLDEDILEPLEDWQQVSFDCISRVDEWKDTFAYGRVLRESMDHACSSLASLVIDIMLAMSPNSPEHFQSYSNLLRQQLQTQFDQLLKDRLGAVFVYDEEYDTDDGEGPDPYDEAFIAPDDDGDAAAAADAVEGRKSMRLHRLGAIVSRAVREGKWNYTAKARKDKEREDLKKERKDREEKRRKKK